MPDNAWTCVVAEDEALLRRELLDQLQRAWPGLRVVAECDDGASALEAIAQHRPQVAFLDIRMPGLSGLEVASAAAEASPCTRIVFVTAYDQYAIDAFERGAIDYLLKPISPERLAATVERLQARGGSDAVALAALIERIGPLRPREDAAPPLTWITASAGRETRLVVGWLSNRRKRVRIDHGGLDTHFGRRRRLGDHDSAQHHDPEQRGVRRHRPEQAGGLAAAICLPAAAARPAARRRVTPLHHAHTENAARLNPVNAEPAGPSESPPSRRRHSATAPLPSRPPRRERVDPRSAGPVLPGSCAVRRKRARRPALTPAACRGRRPR